MDIHPWFLFFVFVKVMNISYIYNSDTNVIIIQNKKGLKGDNYEGNYTQPEKIVGCTSIKC